MIKGKRHKQKYLFTSPVGKSGKQNLAKIIQKFGHEDFDYLIFVYDNTGFKENIYKNCIFLYEKGAKWQFAKKYLTPEYCKKYSYIFFWDDDIDIEKFSYKNFITIMKRNNLEMAQPALNPNGYFGHKITIKDKKYTIGRFTDFVEIMVPVYTKGAWDRFWNIIESDYNFWGWGYDVLAKSLCGYKHMGIIDCQTVTHTKPVGAAWGQGIYEDCKIFLDKYKNYKQAEAVIYGKLR